MDGPTDIPNSKPPLPGEARDWLQTMKRDWEESAREAALAALGGDVVVEAAYVVANGEDDDVRSRTTYWAATTVGLLCISATWTRDGLYRTLVDLTAWPDVRDPELRIEMLTSPEGAPTFSRTFRMQIPRFYADETGVPTSHPEWQLVPFARAVLRHYRS